MYSQGICSALQGNFYGHSSAKSQAQIPEVKCDINQKPSSWGCCWSQNLALKPHYVPAIPGPMVVGLTNDWCITIFLQNSLVKFYFQHFTCVQGIKSWAWTHENWHNHHSFHQGRQLTCQYEYWPGWVYTGFNRSIVSVLVNWKIDGQIRSL